MSNLLSIWDLFLFPVSLPLKFLTFLAEQVRQYLDQELSDEDGVRQQILELRLLYEMDEIEEDEYRVKEKELRARLAEIRELRARLEAELSADEEDADDEGSGDEGFDESARDEIGDEVSDLTLEEMIEAATNRLIGEGKVDPATGEPIDLEGADCERRSDAGSDGSDGASE
jgi:hypothetical protein